MQQLLVMLGTTSGGIFRNVARSIAVAAISALFLSLGSLAQPAAAQGPQLPSVGCESTFAIGAVFLCSASESSAGSETTFTYTFVSGGTATAYIPLLNPNAVVTGTLASSNPDATVTIVTGAAAVEADWGRCRTCTGAKSEFVDPEALIEINFMSSLFPGISTTVSFDSYFSVVSGPIKLYGSGIGLFVDPPVPGVPEPATLALLGT